jgi:hypothetical protein
MALLTRLSPPSFACIPRQKGGLERGTAKMASHYRLTDKEVQNAAPKRGQRRIKLQDGGGLVLVARAKDRKFWTLRIAVDGKTREIGLGSAAGAHPVGLADARDRAFEIRKLLRSGVPLDEAVRRATGRSPAKGAARPTAGGASFSSSLPFWRLRSASWPRSPSENAGSFSLS